MKKVLFLVVLALVLVAMPAFASVQNVKVSGDIDSTFVYRNQFDLGHEATTWVGNQKQNFFMTQTKLRVDADLTDKVSTTVQLLNERAWGVEAANANNSNAEVDLNLAYVTIKEMLYSPLTVVVGRQAFAYGNSFVIDSEGPNNTTVAGGLQGVARDLSKRRAMDAIRAILDYNPLTIDLVYAKVNANNLLSTGATKDDINLYGTNVNYKLGDKYNTVLEGYFWTKIDNSISVVGTKANTVYMPGVHASTNPIQGLMLSGEVAVQKGVNSTTGGPTNAKREGLAYQGIASYQLPFEATKKYAPVATAVYTHVSGDKTSTASTKNRAWDPMFENQGRGKIYNAIFNLTDANIVTAKGSLKPIEDVTLSAEWNAVLLDKTLQGGLLPMVQPDTQTTWNQTMTSKKLLGNEYDLSLAYAYTEDVTIGATLGLFRPGSAFATSAASGKKDATQALVNLDVKF